MPEFIRIVNPSNGTYKNVLININHIIRIDTTSNPDILQVVPRLTHTPPTLTGRGFLFHPQLPPLQQPFYKKLVYGKFYYTKTFTHPTTPTKTFLQKKMVAITQPKLPLKI